AVGGARWWHGVVATSFKIARTLPVPAILLVLTLVLGLRVLYPWAVPGATETNHLLHEKAIWLNAPFFLARMVVVLAIWFAVTKLLADSVTPDNQHPHAKASASPGRAGAASLLLLAVSVSVGFWDWVMSLEPEWFSTIFSVYGFSGALHGGIAAVTVMALLKTRPGGACPVDPHARHTLGILLFAFTMFWAYIWFCQYMLIWYANLPEETSHFATRFTGGWQMLFWLNPIVNFVVPFVALLSVPAKKNPWLLQRVALIILVGRWLDVYLMVTPASGAGRSVPIYAVAATLVVVVSMLFLYNRQSETK
ncbi:MAG: hypothetical protein QGH20_05245, partial [Candidatus Latescibacteria bacterium]|nr:hypothetical protein [Candidatus Latescibacterota bacterium]